MIPPAVVISDIAYIDIVGAAIRTAAETDVFTVFYSQAACFGAFEIIDTMQLSIPGERKKATGVAAVVVDIQVSGVFYRSFNAGKLIHTNNGHKGVSGVPGVFSTRD